MDFSCYQKFQRGGIFLKLLFLLIFLVLALFGAFFYWATQPIISDGKTVDFMLSTGGGARSVAQEISKTGNSLNADLFALLVKLSGNGSRLKAGGYELTSGMSPLELMGMLERGEFAQKSVRIIEGWTFKQMRETISKSPHLKHDTADMLDEELLEKIGVEQKHPEGLFFPDTYLFAKGSSELEIYKQAHKSLMKHLENEWKKREEDLPYQSPYDALIMASIVEKETGLHSDRAQIAGVFVNRLRLGMLLQTDPTVIYGMGERYQGNIRKSDLTTDTEYNTYTREGLPPTPIALVGIKSLRAALHPAKTDALYFVARGDGSTQFSNNLADHNRAVDEYQRKKPTKPEGAD